jgi:transposase
MLYVEISPQDHERLREELKHTADIRWYQRLKIIQLSSERKSVPELATLFDCCQATIRQYIRRYQARGLDGLKRRSSEGPLEKMPLTKPEWEELLHQSPSQFTRLHTGARNWTQELLQTYLQEYWQVSVTQQAISAAIKRHQIRWNRGKREVTSPDPLYPVKREQIDRLKKSRRGHVDQP